MDHRPEETPENPIELFATREVAPPARGPQCPAIAEWAQYRAGLQTEGRAIEMLTHAADCDACISLIADSSEDVADSALIPVPLKSDTPAWKREMAARLTSEVPGGTVIGRTRFRRLWWLAAAAVVILCVSVSTSSSSALWLTAHARERGFDYRLPGAPYRPFAPTRGASHGTSIPQLAASLLIEIREAIGGSEGTGWMHVRGRAALLENRGSDEINRAVDLLSTARGASAGDITISNDLAVALLLRAEDSNNSDQRRVEDVARAIEVLQSALSTRFDPVLQFNLALAYEQQQSFNEALDAWGRFLRMETTGGWAEDARRHVESLKARQKARAMPRSRRAEDAILALAGRGFQAAAGLDPVAIT